MVSSEEYSDVYKLVKMRSDISREEFDNLVKDLMNKTKGKLSPRAAAIIVARRFGVESYDLFYPPIIGRIVEVGPVRYTKSIQERTPFVLFSIVDERRRVLGVAFGEHNVEILRSNEDNVIMIRGYTRMRLEKYSGIKVTENSVIEILDDTTLPPITELKPAWAESLKFVMEHRGAWLVKAIVLEEITSEYSACPLCGKGVEMIEDSWYCPEHGQIDQPVTERIWRYLLADSSGVFQAIYFKEPPKDQLKDKEVIIKAYSKDEEIYIMRFYDVLETEIVMSE